VRGATLSGAAHQADLYAAAENVARVPYYLALALGAVLFPATAAAIGRADAASVARLVGDGIEGSIAVVLPVSAILAGAAAPLVRLFFPAALAGADRPLQLLAPAFGALAVGGVLASIANGAGRQRAAMLAAAVAVGVQVVLGVLLARHHGGVGVAAGTLAACVVALVGQGAIVRRLAGGLHLDPTRIVRLGAAGAAALAIATIDVRPLLALPLAAAAGLAYLAAVVVLRVIPRPLLPLAARFLPPRLLGSSAGGDR
jgi:O-antigen/teichoic acid export membrane protein